MFVLRMSPYAEQRSQAVDIWPSLRSVRRREARLGRAALPCALWSAEGARARLCRTAPPGSGCVRPAALGAMARPWHLTLRTRTALSHTTVCGKLNATLLHLYTVTGWHLKAAAVRCCVTRCSPTSLRICHEREWSERYRAR